MKKKKAHIFPNIQNSNLDKQYLIQYVDFGHSEWIHTKSLRPLHSDFAQLKIQSIAVTLSHVCLYSLRSSFCIFMNFIDSSKKGFSHWFNQLEYKYRQTMYTKITSIIN